MTRIARRRAKPGLSNPSNVGSAETGTSAVLGVPLR